MLDFLERGPLMDEAGGGDGGGGVAVADAASDFGAGAGSPEPDSATEGSEVHDAEFVDPGVELQVREQATPQIKAGERAVQNGKFTASGKAAIEALRSMDAKFAQRVTQDLLVADYYRQQFPGGKKEVAQLRELAEKHGGEQGLGELKQTADFFNSLDQLFSASDPRFVDEITTSDAEKRAFAGLMIPVLNKLDQVAPKQLRHYQMVGFMRVMDGGGIPTLFATQAAILNRALQALQAGNQELAASFLTEIKDNHNAVADFFNRIYTEAQAPRPALDENKNPTLDGREQQLSQREKELQRKEWETSVGSERRRLFSKAWGDLTKGRTLTAQQDSEIKGFYELKLSMALKNWQNQSARFFQNGDKDGYLKEQFIFFQKAIPEALRYAIQRAVPAKPGPKASDGARNGPPRPNVPRGTAQPAQGAVRVAKMPPTSQLDAVRTTGEMLSANKAFTKDGRLVQWA